MKKLIFAALFAAVVGVNTYAHEAFRLVSSEKLSVTEAQLADLQKKASVGKVSGSDLTFSDPDIKLVVLTGPEDDMLSFRIQGLRNPNIVTPTDARLTVWFVNIDGDMKHDIRFAHYMGEFVVGPDVKMSAGTDRLLPHSDESSPFQAEKIVITSNEDGAYKYFCSVGGHAKGGMWGNILVGVQPAPGMKMPMKTEHVHSTDEEKAEP